LYTGDLESCVDILTANRNPTKGTNVFCSHLIQNEVTLTRTSIVMQFKSQMAFTNLEETDMVLIYGEVRGHSELAQ
jgi:rRNA maturation protein Rpf1